MKAFLSNLIRQTTFSIGRFFSTFCLSILFFLVTSYAVIWEPSAAVLSILLRVALTLAFGMLLCTLGKLLFERFNWSLRVNRVAFESGLVVLSGLAYPALSKVEDNQYVMAGYLGVMLALFALILFFSDTKGISLTISHIFKNSMVNLLACLIVFAGTSLCLFAFFSLIHEPANSYKAYLVDSLFIWVVLFLNLSLTAIPHKDTEYTFPKVFRVMICYVALPVYLLLIGILYIYLGKIVVTMSFPSGQVNWFASVASLLFVFFILTLGHYREENKLARAFVRFAGFGIIPIIAMQFIAMYIRLSSYGLTAPRYVSLALNVLALVFAVVSLIRNGRFIKHLLLVAVVASLLLTVTPLNLYDVPLREQAARLTRVLEQNNMVAEGKIVAKDHISLEDKIAITSAFEYLTRNAMDEGKLPDIIKDINRRRFAEVFGFAPEYEDDWRRLQSDYTWYYFRQSYSFIDTEGYSRLYNISKPSYDAADSIALTGSDEQPLSFDITREIEMLFEQYGQSADDVTMEFDVEGGKLLLTYVSFQVTKEGVLTINFFDGYYLVRE
ncbi:MAG: DUF4153 domain-containing protein [Coriobacteriia bacterium]|nr:DUF4153 domain-containing protein [Coriobacteriia bacterium]